jgi:hypothetical protein
MELLPFLRLIWRRRLALGAGIVVALALAVVIGSPPAGSSAVAWTRVDLDTPTSQLVKSAPGGADTLPWRASLLMHLMGTDDVQRELARRLSVRPDQVTVVDTDLALPEVPASMPIEAADAAAVTAAPFVLTLQMPNQFLPIIAVQAAAPDTAGAKRLAAAAVAVLEAQSSDPDTQFSSIIKTGGVKQTYQGFQVSQVAPIRAKPVAATVMPAKQLGVPLFLFCLWAAAVLLLPGRRRRRRRRPRAAPAT